MTEFTPALLAEFKHRVPEGATIPARTPVLIIGTASATPALEGYHDAITASSLCTYWTREPICQPLPTGLGAVLRDVTTTWGTIIPVLVRADMLEDEDYRWFMAAIPGSVDERWLRDDQLATWTEVSKGVELP